MNFQSIISSIRDKISGLFQPQKFISPVPEGYAPQEGGAPQAAQRPSPPAVAGAQYTNPPPITEEQIRRGWSKYGDGNAPAATMSAVFADVANQYPILRKYPGLLPSLTIGESSGGKAKTKNLLNWGIHLDDYNETDPEKVIRSAARAIGSDDSPSSHYYRKFRETGNIRDLLDLYAPPSENDTALYHKQLLNWMKMFE